VLSLALGWAGLLSVMDVRRRHLPNWLTVGGAALFLGVRLVTGGWSSVVDGVAAGAVAGAFLLLPFLMRGAGGGDVKMLFAAGTMVGWSRVLYLLWYMSLAGLALVVIMLAFKRADGVRLKHYARCLVDWRYDRKAGAVALPPEDSDKMRIPFSIAISVGLVLAMLVKL
jgi:prepilin peptidase CpaA